MSTTRVASPSGGERCTAPFPALVRWCAPLSPRVVPPREKCVMVTVETRPAEYPSRPKAQRLRVGRKARVADDPGGAGYEIAKEARACMKCAHDYEAIRAAGDESFG